MSNQFGAVAGAVASRDQVTSAQAWFADGERISYDPKARAMVAGGDAALRVFVRREGNPAQAVSFLPGFPDGSFGWAKVRPHLPNAADIIRAIKGVVAAHAIGVVDGGEGGLHRFNCTYKVVGGGFWKC